jgi:predicted dehydrogenase
MTIKPIRVGLIGASPDQGWAIHTHVPALKSLPGMELVAVGTSRAESAKLSAQVCGVPLWFTDAAKLAAHPDVDLVAISTSVVSHDELVRAVLPAGKPVFCEWPLARGTTQAKALTEAATARGIYSAIGLQGRVTPPLAYAAQLIATGKIGQLLSVTIYSALSHGAGGVYPPSFKNNLDPELGATLLDIYGGHITDIVRQLSGGIATLGAQVKTVQKSTRYMGTYESVKVVTPDNIALYGSLSSGGAFCAHVSSGKANGSRTVIEIAGTAGDLRLESAGPGIQVSELRLSAAFGFYSALKPLDIPAEFRKAPSTVTETGTNVAELYARVASDLRNATQTAPSFSDAVQLHRVVDQLRLSSSRGGVEVEYPS